VPAGPQSFVGGPAAGLLQTAAAGHRPEGRARTPVGFVFLALGHCSTSNSACASGSLAPRSTHKQHGGGRILTSWAVMPQAHAASSVEPATVNDQKLLLETGSAQQVSLLLVLVEAAAAVRPHC